LLQYCLKVYYTRKEKANLLLKFARKAGNMVYYTLNGKIKESWMNEIRQTGANQMHGNGDGTTRISLQAKEHE